MRTSADCGLCADGMTVAVRKLVTYLTALFVKCIFSRIFTGEFDSTEFSILQHNY